MKNQRRQNTFWIHQNQKNGASFYNPSGWLATPPRILGGQCRGEDRRDAAPKGAARVVLALVALLRRAAGARPLGLAGLLQPQQGHRLAAEKRPVRL